MTAAPAPASPQALNNARELQDFHSPDPLEAGGGAAAAAAGKVSAADLVALASLGYGSGANSNGNSNGAARANGAGAAGGARAPAAGAGAAKYYNPGAPALTPQPVGARPVSPGRPGSPGMGSGSTQRTGAYDTIHFR
jgi:hypothetical protein